jgi:hypothetical protein
MTVRPRARNCRPRSRARGNWFHHAAAGGADALHHRVDIDHGVALVAGFDFDIDIGTEHAIFSALHDQSVHTRQTVRGQGRTQPLNDITVFVVMRRLDQDDPKRALGRTSGQSTPPPSNCVDPNSPAASGGQCAGLMADLQRNTFGRQGMVAEERSPASKAPKHAEIAPRCQIVRHARNDARL